MGTTQSKLQRLKTRIDHCDHRQELEDEFALVFEQHNKRLKTGHVGSYDWNRTLLGKLNPKRRIMWWIYSIRFDHYTKLRRYLEVYHGPMYRPFDDPLWKIHTCQQYTRCKYKSMDYEYKMNDDGITFGMWNLQVLRVCYDTNNHSIVNPCVHGASRYYTNFLTTYSKQIIRIYLLDEHLNYRMQRFIQEKLKTTLMHVFRRFQRYPDKLVNLVCDFLIQPEPPSVDLDVLQYIHI
jgi:hypothetical protein